MGSFYTTKHQYQIQFILYLYFIVLISVSTSYYLNVFAKRSTIAILMRSGSTTGAGGGDGDISLNMSVNTFNWSMKFVGGVCDVVGGGCGGALTAGSLAGASSCLGRWLSSNFSMCCIWISNAVIRVSTADMAVGSGCGSASSAAGGSAAMAGRFVRLDELST